MLYIDFIKIIDKYINNNKLNKEDIIITFKIDNNSKENMLFNNIKNISEGVIQYMDRETGMWGLKTEIIFNLI